MQTVQVNILNYTTKKVTVSEFEVGGGRVVNLVVGEEPTKPPEPTMPIVRGGPYIGTASG